MMNKIHFYKFLIQIKTNINTKYLSCCLLNNSVNVNIILEFNL